MRLTIEDVVIGLRDCSGSAKWFVHEFVAKRLSLAFDTITTNQAEEFSNPQMKEVNFAEAQHFISRALYHLAVGKKLVSGGAPTWGLVSFYYSSFFSAQAGIRLRGTTFFRLTYDERYEQAPTYRLEAVNLVTDRFTIRRTAARSSGEHQRVWNAFQDQFSGFGARAGYADMSPVTDLSGPEERLAEMHRRHQLNYVPGVGYYELGSKRELKAVIKSLEQDVRGRLNDALQDPDGCLEAGAQLRFQLCCRLLKEIAASKGLYASAHHQLVAHRKEMLTSLGCPVRLSQHLQTML